MRRCAVLVFTVALAGTIASGGPVRAQEAAAPKPLRLVLEKGKPVRFRQVSRTDQIAELAYFSMVAEAVVARDMTLTPVEPAPDGGWKVKWRFDRIWGRFDQALGTGSFDSAKKTEGETDLFAGGLTALAGTEFDVTLGPRGELRSVAGFDQAIEAALVRYQDDPDTWKLMLAGLINEPKVRAEIDFALLLTPLPEQAGAEAKWTDTDTVPGTSGFSFVIDSERALGAVENGVATVGGTATAHAKADAGRASATVEMLTGASADAFAVWPAAKVSARDGLPIEHDTVLSVAVRQEQEDGSARSVRQVSRFRLTRIGDEPAPALEDLDAFALYAPHVEDAGLREVVWYRRRGDTRVEAEELDQARRAFGKARTLAEAGAATQPDNAEWMQHYVGATKALAYLEGDAEDWAAAGAAWTDVVSKASGLRKAERGSRWFTWEEAHGRVMLANCKQSAEQGAVALALFGAAERFLATARKEDPGHTELNGLHGWCLERWSDGLRAEGKPKDALEKGEASVAIGDATGVRSPRETYDLVNRLWELGDMALEAGDAKRAAELLDRGQKEIAPLAASNEELAGYREDLTARRDAAGVIASDGKPADATQALTMGYLLKVMKRYADATDRFKAALADEAVRTDWESHNLYNGACTAALAHAAAEAAEKPAFEKLAVEWLTPHVARLKQIEATTEDPEQKQWATGYLEWCRNGDPDLASLRGLPAFKAVFGE